MTFIKKTFSFILLAFIFFFSVYSVSFAALPDYTTLAPLPGTTDCVDNISGPSGSNPNCKTNFSTYLPKLFNLSIGIAVVLAFVMITWGGIEYMTTDAIQNKEKGREKVEQAVYGLLLVVGAYVILNTINPQILNFDLDIQGNSLSFAPVPVVINANGTLGTATAGSATALTNVRVNNPCTTGKTTGCTDIGGLQPSTVAILNGLSQSCTGCSILITGGSETGGHTVGSAHYTGNALDIVGGPDLATNIITNADRGTTASGCTTYTKVINNQKTTFLWEPKGLTCGGTVPSTGDHWHVSTP